MDVEMVSGAVATLAGLLAVAFGAGRASGSARAQANAERERIKEAAEAAQQAERRIKVTKVARDVQQSVNHLPDDDVDRQLREKWARKTLND